MRPPRYPSLTVRPARPDEREAAFRLIFQHFGPDLLSARIVNAMEMVRQGELDPSGLLVARDRRGLVGAMVSVPVPGASGLVWPPQTRALPDRIAIEDRLVQATATSLRRQGAKLAQALLTADEQALGYSLERNGFEHITSLWYLRHDLSRPAAFLPTGRLKYRTYHEAGRTLFHSILLRTYENTDDCPEVNGVRTIDEIIAGHLAQGRHDPDRWWLAMHDGQPVGVLLVAEVTDTRAWDIAYVGVVPEARQRGYGREMTHMAMEAARATSTEYLTLAVDNRNRAAWNLYQRLGFEPYDQREVYLAVWSQAP